MEESKALALRDEGGALTPAALASLPAVSRDRIAQLIVRADEFRYYAGLASDMSKGNMLPKGMNKEGAAICMLEGQQFGFSELQSLKHLTAINNTVGLMNVGAISILRRNKALKPGTDVGKEWFWEPDLDEEKLLTASEFSRLLTRQNAKDRTSDHLAPEVFNSLGCRVSMHKKGHRKPFADQFTVGDAKRMGKWLKGGPWADNPMRMLFNRAWGRILTDHFSEYTSGLRLEAELQDDVIDIDPGASITTRVEEPAVEDPFAAAVEATAEAPETPQDAPDEAIAEEAPAVEETETAQEEPESVEQEAVSAEDPLAVAIEEGLEAPDGLQVTNPTVTPEGPPMVDILCTTCSAGDEYPIGVISECTNGCGTIIHLDDEGNVHRMVAPGDVPPVMGVDEGIDGE